MNAFRVLQNNNSAVCNIDGKAKWVKVNWFIGRLQFECFVTCVLWTEVYIYLTTVLNKTEINSIFLKRHVAKNVI